MAEIKYLDLNGLKALYGVVDTKIQVETNRATAAEDALSNKIKAMALTDTAVDGEFITTVSQSDGKVAIARAKVASDKVTATAITGSATTVAVAGDNVAEQIASLGKTLKTVEGNAAKYKVVKLSDQEVTDLNDANVKEAYRVVSYVGADTGSGYTPVGDVIKIYKDGNLVSAKLGEGADAQKLILTYSQADGSEAQVKVDFAAIAFNTEFKDGLAVAPNGEISVKRDAASEEFLTVGEGGVKLAGVKKAIDDAVAAKNVTAVGDEYITVNANNNNVTVSADVQGLTVATREGADSTIAGVEHSLVDGAEVANKVASFTNARISEEIAKLDATEGEATVAVGKHVAVQVVETDGKITAVNVNEDDIASKKALDAEITRAKAAEDKIEASVGLANDGSFTAPAGNYINGATTVMGAVEKLDVQAKANADKIAGMSVDEVNQTVTIDSKSLKFVALTPEEIQKAADDAAGK